MCGIFGFISSRGAGPDVARLQRLARITQARGTHAFGLAWLDADGALHTFKRPGAASTWIDELERCRGATIVIGHCRFATHGSPLDNRNNHPHAAGRGYLVHNGVVRNCADLVAQYALAQRSACDSEILGLLLARCPGALVQRAAWTVEQTVGPLAMLGIWRRPARLLVVRRGNPLHVGAGRAGYYFASLPDGLPGSVGAVPDGSARVLVCDAGGLRLQGRPLGLTARLVGH